MFPLRALAVLLALSLLGTAGTATGTSIDRPSWTPGDFWTYRTNTMLLPGLNLTGTATSTVTGVQSTLSGTTAVNAFRVVLAGSGLTSGRITTPNGTVSVQGSWILTGEERFEPVNLHPIYSLLDLSVNGTYEYFVPVLFSLRFQNTTTFQIVSDGWAYPMVVGTSGTVVVGYNFTEDLYGPMGHVQDNGSGRSSLGFSLTSEESVATPAGTFQAFPLREDSPDGTWQRLLFAPAVGNDVRTEAYDSGGNLTSETTLLAYRYQVTEPPTYLGLTTLQWEIVAAAISAATVVTGFLLWRRARRRKAQRVPRDDAPPEPTSGPRGP